MLKMHNALRHGDLLKLHRSEHSGEVSIGEAIGKALESLRVVGGGDVSPLYNISLGVGPKSTIGRGERGGAHNSATRVSHALTLGQIENLTLAATHALVVGLPLNRMLTVHWGAAGVPLEAMTKATGKYIDLMAKALSRHGTTAAWIWVHENGDRKGGHCHILAHVPPALTAIIGRLQKGWLRSITGRPYRAGVVCSRPIGGRLGLETSNPALHAVNLDAALSYVIKGADDTAAKAFDLTRLEPGGKVIGKRCGTSQNIGSKARKAYQNG